MGANSSNNKRGKRSAMISEINVTPFVDIMLVLLIIFMVTAPLLQQGIDVSLPTTKSLGVAAPSEDPFILTIRKNKQIYLGTKTVPIKDLTSKLKAIFQNRKDKQIYIQADKSVPYEIVAKTLAEIKSSGLAQVSLITNSE